jgi:hypothetical protein
VRLVRQLPERDEQIPDRKSDTPEHGKEDHPLPECENYFARKDCMWRRMIPTLISNYSQGWYFE